MREGEVTSEMYPSRSEENSPGYEAKLCISRVIEGGQGVNKTHVSTTHHHPPINLSEPNGAERWSKTRIMYNEIWSSLNNKNDCCYSISPLKRGCLHTYNRNYFLIYVLQLVVFTVKH